MPLLGGGDHPLDLLEQPGSQPEGRNDDLAKLPWRSRAETSEVVEEVGDVGGDGLVVREQAEVLVRARGHRMVITGADVRVAAQ